MKNIISSQKITDTELKKIYEISEGFPLILTQIASYINDSFLYNDDFQFNQYIKQYEKLLRQPFPDDFQTQNKRTTYVTLKLNIERIKSDESKQLFLILFYLDRSNVDLKILQLMFDENTVIRSLRELKKFSLINLYTDPEDSKANGKLTGNFWCF